MKQKNPMLIHELRLAELGLIKRNLNEVSCDIFGSSFGDNPKLAIALKGVFDVLASLDADLLLQAGRAGSRRVVPVTRRITERLTLSLNDRWFCARDLPGVEAGQYVSLFEISGDVYALLPDTPELHKLEQV